METIEKAKHIRCAWNDETVKFLILINETNNNAIFASYFLHSFSFCGVVNAEVLISY